MRPRSPFAALFVSSAVSTTGFLAANTANSLVAEDLAGGPAWSGLPAAALVAGTAVGASLLSSVVARVGARQGLALGYLLAALAVLAAFGAIVAGSLGAFVVTMGVFGVGFGANRLTRYVAADLVPPSSRAATIGWIVGASTVGAVVGPALVRPASQAAEAAGLPPLSGTHLLCALTMAASAATIWWSRGRDYQAQPDELPRPATDESGSWRRLFPRGSPALAALSTMVASQFVMVLIMTVTPVHVRHGGHTLSAVGLVIAAHTFGMFALAPLTGRVADRVGGLAVVRVGVGLTAASALLAAFGGERLPATLAALFLLGAGWNCGFVAGSALLTDSLPPARRTRVQGHVDGLVWGGGAVASAVSGFLLAQWGFAALCFVGAALAALPATPGAGLWRVRGSRRDPPRR